MDIIQGLIASGNAGRSGWRILNNKGTFGIVNNRTSNVSYSILNNGVIGTGSDFVSTYVASSPSPSITATPSATTTGTTGNYTYQVFTYTTETAGAGTGQSLYTITVPSGGVVCDVLVVGGGGGGGKFGGGGGGGSVLFATNITLTSGSIRVGNGGTGAVTQDSGINGVNGYNSSITINSIEYIAKGGGGGGTRGAGSSYIGLSGNTGGSGGGGSHANSPPQGLGGISNKNTYANFQSFGNNGGLGRLGTTGVDPNHASGGGGGAGSVGDDFTTTTGGGNGGQGKEFISYFGTAVGHNGWFAGGGGGNTYMGVGNGGYGNGGNGLLGGGGNGGFDGSVEFSGNNGLANTGGGGGGSKYDGSGSVVGGTGGSGIVIIRYLTPTTSSSVNLIQSSNINVITNYVGGVSSSSTGGGSSQWTTVAGVAGPEIYYNDGNVGIGTLDPVAPLHIYNNTTTATLPTEIVVAGTTSATISGTTDRVISFPYSGSATTKDYTFTTTENLICDILIVGGGGGGGTGHGGGGGAGALIYTTKQTLSSGAYTISVGNGGTPASGRGITANNGQSSSILFNSSTIYLAIGGGGGGGAIVAGANGGSGGGGDAAVGGTALSTNTPSGNYGFAGGTGANGYTNDQFWSGGGGGGAGAVGGNAVGATTTFAGNGGIGREINIMGAATYYAGGGGGGVIGNSTGGIITNIGSGGNGGGGAGGKLSVGVSGLPNTGGGGGGGGFNGAVSGSSSDFSGGSGGSGIVIIRYRRQTQPSVSNARLLLDATTTGTTAIEFRRGTGGDAQNDFRIINDTNSILKLQCENSAQSFTDSTANIAWFSSNETILYKNTTMNGRVGIGGTTYHATRSLDVVGDANVFGAMSAGSLNVTGNATITNSSSSNVSLTIQNGFVSLPNEIVVAGTTFGTIGTTDRYISFPYSGSATTKDYTITTTENLVCDILVVGGGGGGGTREGGGGGAGALIYVTNQSLTSGTYTMKVGRGGIGAFQIINNVENPGEPGKDSEIFNNSGSVLYRAKGGGGGASSGSYTATFTPQGGSSGGYGPDFNNGANNYISSGISPLSTNVVTINSSTTTIAPNNTSVYGYAGGGGYIFGGRYMGGGGGGAGSVGQSINTTAFTKAGDGGNAISISITGSAVAYAGGGGAGGGRITAAFTEPGTGGSVNGTRVGGIGGYLKAATTFNGIAYPAEGVGGDAVANTGSGGGGAGVDDIAQGTASYYKAGSGGSGIIIIRYRKLTTGSTALELTAPSSSVSITEPIAKGIKQYPETPSTTVNSWTDNGFTVTTKTSDAVLGAAYDVCYLFNNLIASPDHYHGAQLYNGSAPFNYTSSTSFKGANGLVIYIDLGRSITLRNMRIAPRDNTSHPTLNFLTAAPGIFKIYASNDSASWTSTTHASWTEIHSQTTSLTFNYNQFTSFGNFSSITTPYRYFAMVVYNLTGNYRYLTFSEWDIFGTYDIAPVVINSDYKYLSFTHSGGSESQTSYTVNFPESTLCDILVVGGGGGGAKTDGGGGGAGGLLYIQNTTLNGNYTISVGKGGLGGASASQISIVGDRGANSSFIGTNANYIAYGGGGGGYGYPSDVEPSNLGPYGSSGGLGTSDQTRESFNVNTSGQGYLGGLGTASEGGGGGGGSGGAGVNSGNGGIGTQINITGTNLYYAGGGGGGHNPSGTSGGLGGGGSATYYIGNNATYYGGGGGGGGSNFGNGGNGFAGIVIIRYKSTKSGNQTYKVGNFNGEFKVISSVSNTDTDYIKITTAGAITNPTGTASWNTGSDRRIKENIERASYDKCFENINRLELNRFNYISGFNTVNRDRTQLGFIAQEVQDIFPKSISSQEYYSNTLNIPDLLSIDVSQINYSLYGAVKKLIEINNEKDVRLKTLGNRLKTLKTFLNIADVSTSNITV